MASDDWVARYAELTAQLPEIDGVDARVQYVVTGAPEGKVWWYEIVSSGRTAEAAIGKTTDPDVTITWTHEHLGELLRGEVSYDVSFIRGDTKVDGDHEVWVDTLHQRRSSDEWTRCCAELAGTM